MQRQRLMNYNLCFLYHSSPYVFLNLFIQFIMMKEREKPRGGERERERDRDRDRDRERKQEREREAREREREREKAREREKKKARPREKARDFQFGLTSSTVSHVLQTNVTSYQIKRMSVIRDREGIMDHSSSVVLDVQMSRRNVPCHFATPIQTGNCDMSIMVDYMCRESYYKTMYDDV